MRMLHTSRWISQWVVWRGRKEEALVIYNIIWDAKGVLLKPETFLNFFDTHKRTTLLTFRVVKANLNQHFLNIAQLFIPLYKGGKKNAKQLLSAAASESEWTSRKAKGKVILIYNEIATFFKAEKKTRRKFIYLNFSAIHLSLEWQWGKHFNSVETINRNLHHKYSSINITLIIVFFAPNRRNCEQTRERVRENCGDGEEEVV